MNPIDKKSVERILSGFHPQFDNHAIGWYNEVRGLLTGKAIMRATSVLRTEEQQDALYAKGRTMPGRIVTKVKGGYSVHNYGLAIDFCLLVDKDSNGTFEAASWDTDYDFDGDGKADWVEIVSAAKRYGFEWGGDWKRFVDNPHIQLQLRNTKTGDPLSVRDMRMMKSGGHLLEGSDFIDLSDYEVIMP